MASLYRKASRLVLVGLEQEPIIVFSLGLSALALTLAVVVPPIRR